MKQKVTVTKFFSLLLLTALLIGSCTKDDNLQPTSGTSADVPVAWYQLSMTVTKETPGFSPPVAARAFGYIGLGLYESLVHAVPGASSLQGQINSFPNGSLPGIESGNTYHWDIVANAALAQSFRHYYKNTSAMNLSRINALDTTTHNHYAQTEVSDVVQRSRAYGISIADAVYAFSQSDGQDECYKTNFPDAFTPPVGTGLWVPTPPAFSKAMQPYWGETRPFLGINLIPVQPAGPPPYATTPGSKFYQEGLDVYTTSLHLTPQQIVIAKYWSDDPGLTATPPGHSISVATQMIEKENLSLTEAAQLYARAGMAVHDAFVSCWKSKYEFNTLRPVTYIRELFDPNWNSLLTTPPFPEYTSGHSVQTGSLCEILTSMFGNSYAFTDFTHQHRTDIDGSARSYSSFEELAQEAAYSRLYGGIHFQSAIDHGVDQGKQIGANILQLKMLP